MNKLSNNLKQLIQNAKISENELARRTGVPQQVINRILSGENKNPKLATLSPLCNYFMVTLSQMIGDEIQSSNTKLNTIHLGWQEIPVLKWDLLAKVSLNQLLSQNNEKILVDIKLANCIFALRMLGNSMEPKFSEGTILVFDHGNTPKNGDFALLCLSDREIEVRQIFIKNSMVYKKSLNPTSNDYNLTPIKENTRYLGLLIQSKTDFNIR